MKQRRFVMALATVVALCGCATGNAPSQTAGATPTPTAATPTGTPAAATPGATPSAAPASWAVTGSLSVARFDHTATLLADGRVLVVGGAKGASDAESGLASAEIYDPSTGTWTQAAPMVHTRTAHTATLLLDGRVLVAGGNPYEPLPGCDVPSCSAEQSSAELFDPGTGRWSATGSMSVGRAGHSATRLADGGVLVAGGVGGGSTLRSVELYDPTTGKWTKQVDMAVGRAGQAATALADGSVLVAGGFGERGAVTTTERYDPASRTWAGAGSLPTGSAGIATLLPDGRVLLAGGDTGAAEPASAVLFDPLRRQWTSTGPMVTARQAHSTALLLDGRVLAVGGWNATAATNDYIASAEIYDPRTGQWNATASPIAARATGTATTLANGSVLVVGGTVRNGANDAIATAQAEVFTP